MKNRVQDFKEHLIREEKSSITVEKYIRDVRKFVVFAEGKSITKELVIDYKQHLVESGYALRSINSMLASLNAFLMFTNHQE